MAIFKEMRCLNPSTSKAFDRFFGPLQDAAYSGIYQCTGCELEVAVEGGKRFPGHRHPKECGKAEWRLIVSVSHALAPCVGKQPAK